MGLFQKSLIGIKKIFLFRVPMNPQKDWKAKLERPHFFKVQPGKITVCIVTLFSNIIMQFVWYEKIEVLKLCSMRFNDPTGLGTLPAQQVVPFDNSNASLKGRRPRKLAKLQIPSTTYIEKEVLIAITQGRPKIGFFSGRLGPNVSSNHILVNGVRNGSFFMFFQLDVGSATPSYHLWVSISQIRQIFHRLLH